MARWTEAEYATVKAAYLEAIVSGVASCTVGNQAFTARPAADFEKMMTRMEQDLASDLPRGGMRMVLTKPPGAG